MTIGTNIPGMYDYTLQKQKQPGTGPFIPTSPTIPKPTPGPTVPGPTGPATGSPMGGYINQRAQTSMGPQVTPPASWDAYRPTPTSPIAGTPKAPQIVQAPNPVAQVQYTPAATPQPQPIVPKAGPTPQAGQAGSTLQDPGQITEAGKAYAARVTQNLQGNNPIVQNAQQTEDTAAARRGYTARKSTTENLAQTPFTPGSAQYQRAMTESQAGVDAANQQGRNQVNAVTRQATADNMTAANNLEDQQYGRAIGERTDARTQGADLGNSIQDPKAKYAFNAMVASGVDPKTAYQQVVGSTGTINEQYRGQSPVQNVQQDATDWIKATQPGLVEGSPEFKAAVTSRMQEVDAAQRQPVTDANKVTATADLKSTLNSGTPLTPEQQKEAVKSGVIPPLSLATIPSGPDGVNAFLKQNPSGQFAVNGEVYTLVNGSSPRTGRSKYTNSPRHTDVAEVKDKTGKTQYYYDGAFHDAYPKTVGDVQITPFGF